MDFDLHNVGRTHNSEPVAASPGAEVAFVEYPDRSQPGPGECQLRFLWRDALVTMVCLGVLMLPFVLVSAPPDEGTSFRDDESLIEVAVWLLSFPFAAAAMILTVIKTLKAIALSPFV